MICVQGQSFAGILWWPWMLQLRAFLAPLLHKLSLLNAHQYSIRLFYSVYVRQLLLWWQWKCKIYPREGRRILVHITRPAWNAIMIVCLGRVSAVHRLSGQLLCKRWENVLLSDSDVMQNHNLTQIYWIDHAGIIGNIGYIELIMLVSLWNTRDIEWIMLVSWWNTRDIKWIMLVSWWNTRDIKWIILVSWWNTRYI